MIQPIQYHKKMDGKSNSHLITFNDGNDYVVKYLQPGFEKSLANEWISYCIGRYLGAPVPFARMVEIPEDFTKQIPDLGPIIPSQFQFASIYIPQCKNGHEVESINKILNHPMSLASMIVFDYWLANRDRTRKNILLQETNKNTYQLWAIDHAEVFDSFSWSEEDLMILPEVLIKSAAHEIVSKFIPDPAHIKDPLELVLQMPILLLEEIVDLIPEDWLITQEEKKEIIRILIYRRKKVLPKLMKKFTKKWIINRS